MAKPIKKSPSKMPMPKVPVAPAKLPERGQRTQTHNDSKHPGSHDEWEKMGSH